jgi:hypothetical protein
MPRPKVRGVKAGTWMMATSIDENALCALLIGVEGALKSPKKKYDEQLVRPNKAEVRLTIARSDGPGKIAS